MIQKQFFIGKIADFSQKKGWFFGHFMSEPLLKNSQLEIAWQNISGKKAAPTDRHYHTQCIEINIVIAGSMHLRIEEQEVTVKKGEFYVIYPFTRIEAVEAEENVELIVIKTPSVNDKVNI